MKGRASREDIVDQEDAFVFDTSGIVYGKGPVKIREAFFSRERRLRHRRFDSEEARQK